MIPDDLRDDPVMQALAGLAVQSPLGERVARTRARCHDQLGRLEAQRDAAPVPEPFVRRALEPALVAAVAIVFLFDVLRRALMLFRA